MEATSPPAELDRINRKAAVAALGRAVRVYWEHEKARDLPNFLAKLAAAADDACLKTAIRETDALPGEKWSARSNKDNLG
jgi:hypothetical protein